MDEALFKGGINEAVMSRLGLITARQLAWAGGRAGVRSAGEVHEAAAGFRAAWRCGSSTFCSTTRA